MKLTKRGLAAWTRAPLRNFSPVFDGPRRSGGTSGVRRARGGGELLRRRCQPDPGAGGERSVRPAHEDPCAQRDGVHVEALDHWAYWNRVQLDFSRPGKPVDNAFVEAFDVSLGRECLSQHWFVGLEEARAILDGWREDYNNHRPHSSLGQLPPARYRAGRSLMLDRRSPKTLASAGPTIGVRTRRLRDRHLC
jgi:putative transposase